jgi:hypothetical protein
MASHPTLPYLAITGHSGKLISDLTFKYTFNVVTGVLQVWDYNAKDIIFQKKYEDDLRAESITYCKKGAFLGKCYQNISVMLLLYHH